MRIFIFALFGFCYGQVSLPSYNVDLDSWSVSGISSGACMATQMHVAYSASFMGVGMVAGVPYYCSRGTVTASLNCMDSPQNMDVQALIAQAEEYGLQGDNDPVGNIFGDKVYIWQGTVDSTVLPGNGQNIVDFYNAFGADITTEFGYAAEHGFPTDFYGSPCDVTDPEYINNCNYNGAFEILNTIYGGLQRPSGSVPLVGDLFLYDQREFFLVSPPGAWSVANEGYVYVPSACRDGAQCRLHLSLHGCSQAMEELGDSYVRNTGYLEVAELNNIIVLFPQAESSTLAPTNPFGCWDWWGYNTNLYATQSGGQPLALYRMMQQVSGVNWP